VLAQMQDGAVGTAYNNWITTSPGNLAELYDYNGAPGTEAIGAAWANKPTAGSTGQGRVTLSSSKKWGTIMLALRLDINPVPAPPLGRPLSGEDLAQVPRLGLSLSGGNLVFSWGADATGYELETARELNGVWAKVNNPPQLVGGKFVVTITPTAVAQQFFRLHKR